MASLIELRKVRDNLIQHLNTINNKINRLELKNNNYDIYLENEIIYPFNLHKSIFSIDKINLIKMNNELNNGENIILYEYHDYASDEYIIIRKKNNYYMLIDELSSSPKKYILNQNDLNDFLNLFS